MLWEREFKDVGKIDVRFAYSGRDYCRRMDLRPELGSQAGNGSWAGNSEMREEVAWTGSAFWRKPGATVRQNLLREAGAGKIEEELRHTPCPSPRVPSLSPCQALRWVTSYLCCFAETVWLTLACEELERAS